MKKLFRAAFVAVVGFAATIAASAQENQQKPLEVIVFPGGFNWPLFVAQEKSFFAGERLTVNITPTPDSKFQMINLIDGKFDIAMTGMDNVVAYSEGQGAALSQNPPDIFAFMGSDNGFLRLVSIPEVRSYSDLKGKQVGVDALTTGYAFVLLKLLEQAGLAPQDYELVQAGGVARRFEGLMKKDFAATLLVSPFEAAAERQGYHRLADGSQSLGAYQGVVGAARRNWARENETRLVGYIRAYRQALAWLHDPANRAEAIAILKKNVPTMADAVAEVSYQILLDPKTGFARDAALDIPGIAKVLELRSQYGRPQKALAEPGKYYDLRYFEAASR